MESKDDFFSRDQNQRVIQKFIGKLEVWEGTDVFEQERNQHIKLILNSIRSNPEQWSTNCSVNIGWIGSHFISDLSDESRAVNKENMDSVYATCFRFLLEFYLSIKDDLNIEYEQARRFASENLDKFNGNAKSQIEFALRDMPIAILKMLINHDNIDSIKEFNKTSERAEKMREEWNKELEAKASTVNSLKENLDKYKAAFNFVGLFQGFDELASDKYKEKSNILFYLKIFGLLIVIPIISELTYIIYNFEKIDATKSTLVILVLPTISLVGILVYYFRILLVNYNSVKSQILQLELRKTLCRFIQNYVEYSFEIKKKDKESLARFENVVFSGLVSNDDKIPSTFDGIEQLTALIKSVKS